MKDISRRDFMWKTPLVVGGLVLNPFPSLAQAKSKLPRDPYEGIDLEDKVGFKKTKYGCFKLTRDFILEEHFFKELALQEPPYISIPTFIYKIEASESSKITHSKFCETVLFKGSFYFNKFGLVDSDGKGVDIISLKNILGDVDGRYTRFEGTTFMLKQTSSRVRNDSFFNLDAIYSLYNLDAVVDVRGDKWYYNSGFPEEFARKFISASNGNFKKIKNKFVDDVRAFIPKK